MTLPDRATDCSRFSNLLLLNRTCIVNCVWSAVVQTVHLVTNMSSEWNRCCWVLSHRAMMRARVCQCLLLCKKPSSRSNVFEMLNRHSVSHTCSPRIIDKGPLQKSSHSKIISRDVSRCVGIGSIVETGKTISIGARSISVGLARVDEAQAIAKLCTQARRLHSM